MNDQDQPIGTLYPALAARGLAFVYRPEPAQVFAPLRSSIRHRAGYVTDEQRRMFTTPVKPNKKQKAKRRNSK